jgi:molybdopterin synthase sulfur carrier subunit
MDVIFELYGVLERLGGGPERRVIDAHLQHCACAADGQVIRRNEPLPASGRIALLPPVGGG